MDESRTGRFSCGSAIQYALGNRPWADADPETFAGGTTFTSVSQVCPPRLRSNLTAGAMWLIAGLAILVGRWIVLRRREHQRVIAGGGGGGSGGGTGRGP
jgi:hypothetical protein